MRREKDSRHLSTIRSHGLIVINVGTFPYTTSSNNNILIASTRMKLSDYTAYVYPYCIVSRGQRNDLPSS